MGGSGGAAAANVLERCARQPSELVSVHSGLVCMCVHSAFLYIKAQCFYVKKSTVRI